MFHTRFRRFFRLAAIATLLAYLPTNLDLAYAAPALVSAETPSPAGWNFDQSFALALPTELARVESVAPGRKGTLLHIQTAHGHYEAQRKIEELLDWLSEKYGDYPVFVEGAAGKLDPARLAFFPNQPELNFQNARWLAKKALVTGPELYLLKKQSKNGVGIELPESYEKNHAQFKRVLTARGEAKVFSDAFNLAMEKAAAIFSPDLRAFLKRLQRHELEVIPLENWMAELQRAALKHLELDLTDTAWQVRWPMLVRFFKIQALAKQFDPGTYESEKKIFLAQAKPYLADTKELYRRIEQLLGSAGQSIQLPEPETENTFVEMLHRLPRDFDFKAYSQVTRFAALLILQSEISPSALQGEIRRLETLIAEKLTRTENEKEALKIFSDYRLLEKLLALQLAPADFEKVKDEKQKTELAPSKIAEKLKLETKSIDKLDRVFEEAIAFYQGAQNRDQVMVQRAENYLKQSSARFSVVITGGFHTEAMREHFEKAGYAYAVATPAISGADEDGYRAYLKAMLADLSQTNLIPNSMIELAQALNPGLGDSTKVAALRATVGRVRAGEIVAPDHSDLDEMINRKKRSAAWGLQRMAPDGSILTPGEIADRSTGAGLSDYEKDFRSEVREAVLPEKSASQSEQVPAHIQSLINDIEKLERSLWPTQFRDLKIALFQNRLNDATREAESLKPSIRPEHPLVQDVYNRVLALRSESRKDLEKHQSPWLKRAWNLSMVLNVSFVLTAGWFAFQGQASWLMAALFAGLAAFVVTGVVMGVGYLIYRDHQEELDLIHKGAEESRRSLAREKLTQMRLGLTALATLGALAGSPQKADAAFGEEILPSPTNTLNDISKVSGIQSSGHIYSGSIPPTPSPVAFTLNNDRRMTMTANFSGASSGAEAEVNTSFDNPNTPAIESVNMSALSSNGVFRVGLRDANATSGAGVVTLYVDDASGSSDFVFLSGVDNTNRVWEVPLSLFDEVNTNQIKAIAFVLFNGSMPNTNSSLSVYFRGHPFAPFISSGFSPSYSSLTGVSTGTSTAYPPVAVSEVIGGGAITSLVSSVTNFIAHYVLTNSNSVVKVQIDRGTLDEAEIINSTVSASGQPQFSFIPIIGNLYGVESSTNLLSNAWQTHILYLSSGGMITVTNYAVGSQAGFARVLTKLFPPQNMNSGFSFLLRSSRVGMNILGELVDTQGISFPFRISGSTLNPPFGGYTIPNDSELLPEGFLLNSIDIIRFSVPQKYQEYPSGTNITNLFSSGSFEFRLQNGIGPVGPPRSEMRDIHEFNFTSYPWRNEETVESLIRIFLNKAGVFEAEQPHYRLFKVETEDAPEISEEYRGQRVEFDSVENKEAGEFLAENFGSNRADRFKTVWVGLEEPVVVPSQTVKKAQARPGVSAGGKKKIILKPRDPSANLAQAEAVKNIATRAAVSAAKKAPVKPKSNAGLVWTITLSLIAVIAAAVWYFSKADKKTPPATAPPVAGQPARSELRALTDKEITTISESAINFWRSRTLGAVPVQDEQLLVSTSTDNSLVELIKPKTEKITANTIAEVIKDLRLRGWGLNALRVIPSQVIREKRLISKHYPRHYQVAILGSTALNDDEKKSVEAYLVQQGWEQPDAAQVYSAAQLINESGISARELILLWKQAMAAGKVKKLGQGARAFRVGAVNFPKRDQFKHQFSGKTILVYNAFYPAVEENFSESENPTIAFWIKPIEGANAISAEQMKNAAGDTNPAEAAKNQPDSLRARAYNHDPALELAPQVNFDVEDNFIHMTDPADIAGWPVGSGEFQAWFGDLMSQARRSELRWESQNGKKILVVGTGFVGATKAILQAIDFGHDVVALDVIKEKLDQLRAGELPFEAEYLPELLKEAIASGRLTFTQDYASALEGRKYIYLALPTPQSDSGEANTSYLESAVRTIAENLKPGEQKILIGKSTAPPKWTVEKLRQVADEVLAKRRAGGEDLKNAQIQFAWEPEFLREAKEVEDDRGVAGRLVIGAETRKIAEEVRSLYLNWDPSLNPPRREVPIILTDIASGPLVKYAANGYRALKISFINFISWLTEELGFDINEIADAVGLDPRVIRNFLTAGPGFGGSCFPKDLAAFIKITKELGVSSGIILDALAVNQVQIDRFVEKMESNLDGFKGKKIVLLGGAFKAGTSDTRESRAVIAAKRMIEAGASVIIVDPAAKEELEKVFRDYNQGANKPVAFYGNVAGNYEAIFSEASAIAVMTEWPEFKNIDFNQLRSLYHHGQKLPSFFDARNLFERRQMESLGFEYFDIGRGRKPFGVSDEDHRRAKSDLVDWAREFFLVLRISYINIVAEVAEKLGANILDVQKGFGYDPVVFGYRPDKNGEIDYLDPGIGWGGHDLVDALRQMEAMAEASVPGLLSRFVTARGKYLKRFGILGQGGLEKTPFVGVSRDINQHQIQLHVEKIKKILGVDSVQGKTISILGVAYKKGTYSIEGSPSVDLIEALFKEGARVHMWDPEAAATAGVNNFLHENVIHGEIQSFLNPHDAMRGTDLQVVVHVDNGYEENVAHLVMDGRGNKVATRILDARHVFSDPQAFQRLGVEYHAIGVPLSKARSEARVITLQVGEDQDFDGFNFTLESIANGKATVKITSPTSEFAAKKRGTVFETNTQNGLAAGDLIQVENVSGKGPIAKIISLTANSIVLGSTRSEARAELPGTPYQTHEERLREYLMSVPVGGEVDYSRFETLSFDRRSSLFDEFAVFYIRDEKKHRRGLAVEKWDFNERESVSLPALPNIQAVSFPYDARHFQIPLNAFSNAPFSFYFSDFGRRVEVSLKSDRSVILSIKSIAEKKEEGVIHLDSDNVYAQLNSAEGALRLSRVKRSWSNQAPELRFSLQNNNLVITHYLGTNPHIFLDRDELNRFPVAVAGGAKLRSEERKPARKVVEVIVGEPTVISGTFPAYYRALKYFLSLSADHEEHNQALEVLNEKREWFVQEMIAAAGKEQLRMVGGSTQVLFERVVKPVLDEFISIKHLVQIEPIGANGIINEGEKIYLASLLLGALNTSATIAERFLNNLQSRRSEIRANVLTDKLREKLAEVSKQMGNLNRDIRKIKDPKADKNYSKLQGRYKELDARRVEILIALASSARSEMRSDSHRTFPIWLHRSGLSLILGGILLGSFFARLYYGIDSVSDLLPWASMLVGGFLIEEFWRLGFRVRQLSDDEIRKTKTAKSVLSGRSEMRMMINGGEYDPAKAVEIISALRRDLEAPEIQVGLPDGTLDLNRKFIWLTNYNQLRFAQGTTRSNFKDMGGFAVQLALESALLERFKVDKPTDVVLSHDPVNGPIADYRYYFSWSVLDGVDAEGRSTAILNAARVWLDEKTAEAQQILNPPEPTTTKRSEMRWEESAQAVLDWKEENIGKWDEYLPESPFETRLESKVRSIYEKNKINEFSFEERRLFIEAVFGAKEHRGVLSGIQALLSSLDPKALKKLNEGSILSGKDYRRFGGVLARLEHLHPILEAHYIRLATYLLFDFWDHETRVLEISWLLDSIESEFNHMENESFPITAAMQDLHGGTRRALALVGFLMGLPANVYTKLHSVEDLEYELGLIGKSLEDFPGRIIGLNDKYDRGGDPVGSAKLVQKLTATGKGRPIVGNHDLWRAEGALGIHLLFRAIAEKEGHSSDYYEKDGAQKTHHPASWAEDAFPHEGWGVVELEQMNQSRFNRALAAVNHVLVLNQLEPFLALDLASIRSSESEALNRLKKEISKKRKDMIAGTISKDEFEAFQKAHPLPDVHGVVMEKLRAALAAYNDQIRAVNDAKHLDIPALQFSEVNLENYYRDPEIIERTLWELKNFRLFYVDILGNLHMHNIIPIDYKRGGFDVQYKGKRGLAAMELIARDIRFFFENLETIPDSQAFRQKMWEQIGEAITVVNGWYSDLDPQAKVPAIKRFVDEGKMEGLLGHAEDVPVDREVSGIFFWGHNERSKLLSPGGDLPPLPYAFLYPDLGTALFNIDGEMSEGYSDRGMIVTMGMKVNGKATGLRVWGFRKGSNVVEDLTFEDIPGMPDEQHAMLKHLHDDRGFLEWNRARLLKEMIKHLNILILSAENKKRSDADGSKLDHYRQLRMRMSSWLEQEDVSKAFTRRSESRSQKTDPIWLGLDSPTADWQRMNTAIWVYLDMKERGEGNAAEDVIKRQIAEKLNQMGLGVGENDLNRIWGSVKATAVLEDSFQAGINSDHAFYFKEKLEQLLTVSARRTGTIAILELFEAYEKAAEEWPLYALESRWPMLRAVAMMNKETQKALLEILSDSPKKFGRFRLTDTIFLMLGEELLTEKEYEAYISKWMKSHAPSLIGRDIYYVSPETWLLAGGLGRVGQYHTRGVRKLLAKQGRLLTIEPLYHYRIRPDGSQHPLDYSKLETPVLDLEDSYEFSVTVKGQQVSVAVKKGRTEDDIPVYLLDGGDFYTRALYKYGSQYGSADWKAFTEFFSRASLELIRRIEIEKQAEQGAAYKAPVVWGNDGQSGLLPVYKRMLDKSHRVLRKAFVWFTTHTFANRGYFGWEDSFVRDAGLSQVPYSDLFVNRKNNAWDATSGGVNGADGVNGVAAAHRHEVSLKDPDATEVSISNGDDLNKSAAYFREVLVSLYPGADIWRPTGEQILKTKAEAIRRLNPKFKTKYGVELNPNAPVASYSGRKVHEKDGLERAFTAYNLRQLVLGGVNVAYFGNTQVEPDHSFEELKKQAQAINSEAERLEKETGKKLGRMIVATGWNLHDQVEILAITHIQVQDSNYKTGASEVTEANFSVNGGLNMGPAWTEGNIQKIGIVLDPKVPGSGNILIPRDSSPAAYLERLTQMTELFYKDPDHFGSYLETSVRLSRVVNAMLPASEYLLQFEAGVRQKDALSTLSSKIKKGVLRTYSSGAFKNTALARELREISKMSYADAAALYGERALASVAVAIAFLLPETLAEFKSWNFPGFGMLENYVAAPEHEVLFRDDAVLRVHQTDHYGVIMFSRASKESGRVLTPAVRLESVAWDQQSRKTWAAGIENIERIVDPSSRAIYRVGDYSVAGKISHIYPKRPTGEEISKSHRLGVPTMPHDSPDANVRHEIAGAQLLFLEKEAPARSESRKGQEESLRELRSLINSRKLGERERAQAIQLEEKLNRVGWTLRALEDATAFVKQHSSRSENRQEIQLGKDQIVTGTFTDDFRIQINEDSYYKIWFREHPHFGVKGVPKNEFLMQRFSVETNQAVGKVHYLVGGREVAPQLKNLARIPQPVPFIVSVEWKEDAAHFRLVGNDEKSLPVNWSGSVNELSVVKKVDPSQEDREEMEDRSDWARLNDDFHHEVLSAPKMKTTEFEDEFAVFFGKQHIRVWKQAGNKDNLVDGEYYFQRQVAAGKKPAGVYPLKKGETKAVFPYDGGISYAEISKIKRGMLIHFTMKVEDKNGKSVLTVQNRGEHSEITILWVFPRSEARQPTRATEKEYPTLEEARQILVKWLEGIVPQKWLAGLRFEEAASTVTRFTTAVAFAGEVPMVLPSLLAEHQPNAAWQFARTELKVSAANTGRVGQVILHPQVADLIAANGRAAFEILKQFSNQAGSDIAPLVIFSAENNLKDQILKAMTNLRSGLTPTEKGEAGNLIKLLQIESVVSGSAEEAMNRYLAEYQKTWALAALLPNENLLDQIQSPLKMALAEKTVAAEDVVVFAKIAKALYQAALLGETDQIRYLSENLSGASKTARGWVVSLKTLIDALVLTRELIATSA